MAKDTLPTEQPQPPAPAAAPRKLETKKLILIGVPLFLVQLALVYFLTAKFVAPTATAAPVSPQVPAGEKTEGVEQHIFLIKDLIVNPAGTNGTRFLLTTIGVQVSTPEAAKELETKEVQVRDVLNTILTSKGLGELVSPELREKLRLEIAGRIGAMLKTGKLENVYFSKFIIQ